jgi:hypothetical protein
MNAHTTLSAFDAHPFNFLWEGRPPATDGEALAATRVIERRVADLLVNNEPDPATRPALDQLFMPYHQEGTFMIGARRDAPYPQYIRGEPRDFATWVRSVVRADLVRMLYAHVLPSDLSRYQFEAIGTAVLTALQCEGSGGTACDAIPNQNYIDYVRRGIGLYLFRDAEHSFDTEDEYNDFAIEVALLIICRHLPQSSGQRSRRELRRLMVFSLLAGVIGLDLKCSHCAASLLTHANAAASGGQPAAVRAKAIYQWLVDKENDASVFCPELFAWKAYESMVLSRPCTLCVFSDDVGETVFDLHRIQAEMAYNAALRIVFVPRNGRFHNDCALEDVEFLMEQECFVPLRRLRDSGRFVVSVNGPRNGAIEPRKMNRRLVETILEEVDVLFVKGARSYEMIATGIRLPTFTGQTVSREFSESVIGASAAVGVPVLRFVRVFPDFWGFTERHQRIEPLFPDGRLGWQASMTAIDSARFIASSPFIEACRARTIEEVSTEVVTQSIELRVPPHRLPTSAS